MKQIKKKQYHGKFEDLPTLRPQCKYSFMFSHFEHYM